jgi:hypothetical protein
MLAWGRPEWGAPRVSLEASLHGIQDLSDLPRLVAALGHAPLYEPAPRLLGRARLATVGPAVAVGRIGAFPWFAVPAPQPERAAQSLARRLGARGRIAGVIALDTAGRRLALAVGLEGTPSLCLDLDHPSASAVASLARMAGGAEGGALAYAAKAAEALSTESAGKRFFAQFKLVLESITTALPHNLAWEDRHAFALLQLTRVLFLYFIQAKGWLGGRERFMGEEVDRCLARRNSVHRHLLQPLFFGTLNRPIAERGRLAARFGAVPFLNGGLFEPHPLERLVKRDIPNEVWRVAFDRLFERFHFTVAEGSPAGEIAPDMLGRVFEGVMAPDVRRASGTFYTPAALVATMIDTALAAMVAARLGCSQSAAERKLDCGDDRASAAISGITILDPAVGSGAFLLGALERLVAIIHRKGEEEAARRRWILQHSLFGVDRSAAAVRLAELRLWLAVVAGEKADRPSRVRPLPNLDCLIRQGDSLFEPAGCGASLGGPSETLARQVAGIRPGIVIAHGPSKRPLVRELQRLEARIATEAFADSESRIRDQVMECLRVARARDLFGQPNGLDPALRARVCQLRAELRAVRTARRTLIKERELPWFHYQSHFPDIFAAGGFDLVVGNPPWLRAEEIPREQRQRLADRFRWWRGGSGFGNRPDLSVAFLERAFELVKPGGIVALLVPAKLATASYGTAARHALAATVTLISIANLTHHPAAAFDATVYPLAVVARRAVAPRAHGVHTSLGTKKGEVIAQSRLGGGGPWILMGGRAQRVAASLGREHPLLRDSVACHLGLKTGANALFLNPPAPIEAHLIRHAIRGRDVAPFHAESRVRLLFTHGADGAPLPTLPTAAAAHLAPHLETLRARADFVGGAPWALFRTRAATSRHRVIWADLSRDLAAAALTGRNDRGLVPLNTCYVAAVESSAEAERLVSWLNCSWIRAAARLSAVPAASGYARFAGTTIGALPLPPGVLRDSQLERIAIAARGGTLVQDELDDLTARHLGLSAPEQDALRSLVASRATSYC